MSSTMRCQAAFVCHHCCFHRVQSNEAFTTRCRYAYSASRFSNWILLSHSAPYGLIEQVDVRPRQTYSLRPKHTQAIPFSIMTMSLTDPLSASGFREEPSTLHPRLYQATTSSMIHETLPVAFNLLFGLLNTPELVKNPILHTMTHTLIALNIPLYTRTKQEETSLKDSSGQFGNQYI